MAFSDNTGPNLLLSLSLGLPSSSNTFHPSGGVEGTTSEEGEAGGAHSRPTPPLQLPNHALLQQIPALWATQTVAPASRPQSGQHDANALLLSVLKARDAEASRKLLNDADASSAAAAEQLMGPAMSSVPPPSLLPDCKSRTGNSQGTRAGTSVSPASLASFYPSNASVQELLGLTQSLTSPQGQVGLSNILPRGIPTAWDGTLLAGHPGATDPSSLLLMSLRSKLAWPSPWQPNHQQQQQLQQQQQHQLQQVEFLRSLQALERSEDLQLQHANTSIMKQEGTILLPTAQGETAAANAAMEAPARAASPVGSPSASLRRPSAAAEPMTATPQARTPVNTSPAEEKAATNQRRSTPFAIACDIDSHSERCSPTDGVLASAAWGKRERRDEDGGDTNGDRNGVGAEDEGGESSEEGQGGRKKMRLSREEVTMLEDAFRRNPRPTQKQKEGVARRLGVRLRQVEVWFQNRRARTKIKQTEVELEELRRRCEVLEARNESLVKELQAAKGMSMCSECIARP